MGLDICFNKALALKAGGEYSSEKRVYDEETIIINWFRAGKMQGAAQAGLALDNNDKPLICVRANKWGRNYAPLTEWLSNNNIQYTEA